MISCAGLYYLLEIALERIRESFQIQKSMAGIFIRFDAIHVFCLWVIHLLQSGSVQLGH